MFDPLDLFWQALAGNWVAWFAIILCALALGMLVFLIILWLKLPQFAKAAFINNTVGGNKPTIAQCYENKRVVFTNPKLYRSGLAYDKRAGWFLFPKAWATSDVDLSYKERQLLGAVYTIDGTQSAFYLNLSVQASVSNPELLALFEHETQIKALADPNAPLRVKTDYFRQALSLIKDEYIQIRPMHLNLPIDIKGLKTMLPKALPQSEMAEQENRIRDDLRREKQGLNLQVVIVILGVISVVVGIVGLLKLLNVF
jgi:hypothetical protein